MFLTFFLNLFLLGISSWASNFSDSAVEPDAFVSNWEDHMGWKYCPNWILFWGRYGNEVQHSDVTWKLVEKSSYLPEHTSICYISQFSSVSQLSPTLRYPMDCSTPGLPVHCHLPEFTQMHVHWVSDAIQPSHPLSSPSPAFNFSQHQGLFRWVSSSLQVAKILEFQHQSFQWIFRTDFL